MPKLLDPLDAEDDAAPASDYLPAIVEDLVYELEPFQPIDSNHSEEETTRSDLAILNNQLAVLSHALPAVRTIQSLCALTNSVCKAIEYRRKVKKLPFGEPTGKGSGKTFEVLE